MPKKPVKPSPEEIERAAFERFVESNNGSVSQDRNGVYSEFEVQLAAAVWAEACRFQREADAQLVEKSTYRSRWLKAAVNSDVIKDCEIARAIRGT